MPAAETTFSSIIKLPMSLAPNIERQLPNLQTLRDPTFDWIFGKLSR